MARINLLPWRKEQRERRNKEFNVLAAATAGVAALVVLLVWSVLGSDLSNQLDANKRIEDANTQLDVALKSIEELEVQREQMIAQMKVVQDLQGRRSIPVRVWDDMARAIEREAMYVNNIKRNAEVITLTGFAANPNVVASLVRNLNASEWLDASAVVSIKSKLEAYQGVLPNQANSNSANKVARQTYPEDSYIEFVVTTKVQNPQTEEEKAKAGTDASNEDVPLPPLTTEVEEMPEVAPIGIENAPADTPAPTPEATPASPAPAEKSVNEPTVVPTVDAANAAPQEVQSAPSNNNVPVGGQK